MITQERLKEVLHYDPDTGLWTWLIATSNRIKIGSKAGSFNNGYLHIKIDGKRYKSHRLAWFYMIGEWPHEVDHIDTIKHHNWWPNLRLATHSQNCGNQNKRITNTSGYKGVSWSKRKNKWQAGIKVNYKRIGLGYFDEIEDAVEAYKVASQKYFGEFSRS